MTSKTSQPNSQIATPPDGRALHDRPGRHHLVIGIALTVARSGGGSLDPEQAHDRHPAASRSALWTRVVFPEPSRAEFEEVTVDQAIHALWRILFTRLGFHPGHPRLPVFGLTSTGGEEPCGSSDSSAGAVRPRPPIPGAGMPDCRCPVTAPARIARRHASQAVRRSAKPKVSTPAARRPR
jgi:hypothetical protein